MRELVIGNGLCGNAVYEALTANGAEVYQASRRPNEDDGHSYYVDMLDQDSISAVLRDVQPDVIINTAAVLGRNGDQDLLPNNPVFARNLIESARHLSQSPRVVMLGSAAVYGVTETLPVTEDAPMNAQDPYGRSKREESEVARTYADMYGINLAEARLGNPLSPKLPGTNLSSIILKQMLAIQSGQQEPIVNLRSTESSRDYTDLQNVVDGIITLARTPNADGIYNIASGESTTNGQLATMLLRHGRMSGVEIRATDEQPEPAIGAAHMDISRLRGLGWEPQVSLDQTTANLVQAAFSAGRDRLAA